MLVATVVYTLTITGAVDFSKLHGGYRFTLLVPAYILLIGGVLTMLWSIHMREVLEFDAESGEWVDKQHSVKITSLHSDFFGPQ